MHSQGINLLLLENILIKSLKNYKLMQSISFIQCFKHLHSDKLFVIY